MSETGGDDAAWTIRRVLSWTTDDFKRGGLDSPRLDAELLIADALGIDRVGLYIALDKPLRPGELTAIRARVERRRQREPIAYITGYREFWSLSFRVDPRVLIPRPDTERLVEIALSRLRGRARPTVVDIGTGSGCIALALASERPDANIVAVDLSEDALELARQNADALGIDNVVFRQDRLFGPPDEERRVTMVVSNPPYIATGLLDDLMPEVSRFEPRLALDGGADGLETIRPLVDEAAEHLVSGGELLIEIGYDQGEAVSALISADGRYEGVCVHADYAGADRVVEAVRL